MSLTCTSWLGNGVFGQESLKICFSLVNFFGGAGETPWWGKNAPKGSGLCATIPMYWPPRKQFLPTSTDIIANELFPLLRKCEDLTTMASALAIGTGVAVAAFLVSQR